MFYMYFPIIVTSYGIVFSIIFLWKRYRGVYLGLDVAVKVLRSEHLNDTLKKEFAQEVAILR